MDTTLAVLAGLTPSVGVGLLFWFAMRKILRADRHEREALERMDREGMASAAENTGNSPSH
jgi:predicted permease